MANFSHFSDMDGQAFELHGYAQAVPNAEAAARWPGIKARKYDGYAVCAMKDAAGVLRPVTRSVEMKARPSRHECDARCINATGRVMRCECSCGGKNHGRGAFNCSAVAA